jgi:transposase
VLGTKDNFTPALWRLAVQQQLPTARHRSTVGDGALWIWEVAEDVCPAGTPVVDWFHAVQHLNEAAYTLYPNPDDAAKRQRWLKTYKEYLYMGRIHKIIAALHKQERDDLAGYFELHQHRMQ